MAGDGRHSADAALLAALLGGATPAEAAKKAGVSEHTARRRLADRDFHDRLDAAGDELFAATARGLTEASTDAVDALHALVLDGPPAVQHGAARTILELGVKWRYQGKLEEQIAALARAVAELQHDLHPES
ncbi:MAG: hypothetical protein ACLQBX_02525 [Candidatus Limnocylindrales bacterium]